MSKSKSSAAAVAPPPAASLVPFTDDFIADDESATVPESPASGLDLIDEEIELGADPTSPTLETLPPPKPLGGKELEEGAGDSMLARYFREMATHPVMGQEEELQTAMEVEEAEVDHWVAIISYVPAAEFALASLEKDLPTGDEAIELPQLAELHKLIRAFKKQKNKLTREQDKKWKQTSITLARAIRLADSDRLWIAHSEEAVRKLGEGEDLDEADDLTLEADEDAPKPPPARDSMQRQSTAVTSGVSKQPTPTRSTSKTSSSRRTSGSWFRSRAATTAAASRSSTSFKRGTSAS